MILAAFLLPVVSCSKGGNDGPDTPDKPDNPSISIPTTDIVLSDTDKQKAIYFTTNTAWTAKMEKPSTWCRITPVSGSPGLGLIEVDADINDTYDDRSVKIVLTAGGKNTPITITQRKKGALILTNPSYRNISYAGQTIDVELKTNLDYEIKPKDTWVEVVKTKGLSTYGLQFYIYENKEYGTRNTEVVIKDKASNIADTLKIEQLGSGIVISKGEGTLARTLGKEVMDTITVLVIEGPIDAADITAMYKQMPLLACLDLGKAIIDKIPDFAFTEDVLIGTEAPYISDYKKTLRKITLPSTLKEIGNCAFARCPIEEIVIPNTVISIGIGAFAQCHEASGTLIIPGSLKTIKMWSFWDCKKLTELTIKEGVQSIEKRAFSGCQGFKGDLIIPNSVESLGEAAFVLCDGFDGKLVVGSGIRKMDRNVFSLCNGFINLILKDGITVIGEGAFGYGFTGTLTIPNSVTSIGKGAFSGCYGFTGSLTIPSSVTSIGASAFAGCSGFTGTLIIPNSITSIESGTFRGCSGFTGTLTIPNRIISIGATAFQGCSGFTALTLSNSITFIGNSAFRDCVGFSGGLIIPNSISAIEDYTFAGCRGFTGDLVIPGNIKSIGKNSFKDCTGFTGTLTIPNTVTSIGEYAFSGCSNLSGTLSIPNGIQKISPYSFEKCSGFTGALNISSGVISVGKGAFAGCYGFEGTLNIPNSITIIEERAFSGCSGFTGALIIPNSVTSIGECAFASCTGFTSVKPMSKTPIEIPEYQIPHEDGGFRPTSPFYDVVDNLIVPKGSIGAYRNSNWGQSFKNISDDNSL